MGGTVPARGRTRDLTRIAPRLLAAATNPNLQHTSLIDSNSTRTESCVSIRPDPKAQMRVGDLKAADHNG
jgi:hypothetical protein